MKINFYCESVGGKLEEGQAVWSGPAVVAYNLALALEAHSSHKFTLFQKYKSVVTDERVVIYERSCDADINHVLNSPEMALNILTSNFQDKIILGPNLFRDIPDQFFLNSLHGGLRASFEAMALLAKQRKALLLFPHLTEEQLERAKKAGFKVASWPCGIDTASFVPEYNKRRFDFLILSKGGYSEPSLFTESLEMARSIKVALQSKYSLNQINAYKYLEYPELLNCYKCLIFTSPSETQGLALMEAQACGVPVIHRSGFPYQPEALKECWCDFTHESFIKVAQHAINNWRELGEKSASFIRERFTLKHMFDNYERLIKAL